MRIALTAVTGLLVVGLALAGCGPQQRVEVPPPDAGPTAVVDALIAAIGARDAQTVAAVSTEEFAEAVEDTWFGVTFVEADLDAPVGGDVCLATAYAGTDCVYVPAQLVLEGTDASMPDGEQVGWGYLLTRTAPDARWLVFDQGVG